MDNSCVSAKDVKMVSDTFEIVQFSSSPIDQLKIYRIGKFSTSRCKPRPLKLQFVSSNHPTEFLTATRKASATLKQQQILKDVVFAEDRTKMQQEQYRSLKLNLQERLNQGEQNLMIRHINGTPTIVPTHQGVVKPQESHIN